MHMNSQKHDDEIPVLIEKICQQGCTVVRQHIETLINLEQQDLSKPLPTLLQKTNKSQQKEILNELLTIMAVYDNSDCDEN